MGVLGDQLVEVLSGARQKCLLVAPYIKLGALTKVLQRVEPSCAVRVITRWRIDEIAAGVNDLEVWQLLRERGSSDMWLQPTLHAKYYRADERVFIGSANLTDAALGWSSSPNLEILEELQADQPRLREFERALSCGVTPVTDELYHAFATALGTYPKPPMVTGATPGEVAVDFVNWRPAMRYPEDLFSFYVGDADALTSAARDAAARDLAALQPPSGLSLPAFDSWIGLAILQNIEFQAIDKFIVSSRRFGEMRQLLATRGADDASRAWQTWMRWILHFLPDHFAFHTANYSEIVSRRRA